MKVNFLLEEITLLHIFGAMYEYHWQKSRSVECLCNWLKKGGGWSANMSYVRLIEFEFIT